MDFDLKGRPIEEKPDGSLFTADGEYIGQKTYIEKPGYDTSAIHKRQQDEDTRKGIANMVLSGDYGGAVNALLTLIKAQKKEQKNE